MGTTFVSLGRDRNGKIVSHPDQEVGFWMPDSLLQLWLRLLALHVEEPVGERTESIAARDQWLLASGYAFPGCVPHGFEEATATPRGLSIVRSAVESLFRALADMTEPLSRHVLNLMAFEDIWEIDIDIAVLLDVATAFAELLDFKVHSTASSTDRMPGSIPRPRFQ